MDIPSAHDIGWELYRSYLAVLREGSLSAAARALGLTQPTLGRHIAALEEALGLVLFTRSQQGLLPTEAALALQPHAEAMAHAAAALARAAHAQGEGVRGTVRVSASHVVGTEVLPPLLARLQAEHPALTVELALSDRLHDLLQREADIAIRMAAPRQEALVVRRVGAVGLGLHAHPDYLRRHGMPQSLADLQQGHRLIGFDAETPFIRAARQHFPAWQRERFSLRSDSDLAQLACIRAGAGIGICQTGLALRPPALVRVLPDAFAWSLDTWVVMHEDLRHSPRCRATFDALVAGLQRYLADGAGVPV